MIQPLIVRNCQVGYVGDCYKNYNDIYGNIYVGYGSEDIQKDILRKKIDIARLADVKNAFKAKRDVIKLYKPAALAAGITAATYAISKLANIDYIYVGRDLQNYAIYNGTMLSFSEYLTIIAAQTETTMAVIITIFEAIRKRYLNKQISNINDDITYGQMLLGALRKRAAEVGLEPDYKQDVNVIASSHSIDSIFNQFNNGKYEIVLNSSNETLTNFYISYTDSKYDTLSISFNQVENKKGIINVEKDINLVKDITISNVYFNAKKNKKIILNENTLYLKNVTFGTLVTIEGDNIIYLD